jgi:hypothetical protein
MSEEKKIPEEKSEERNSLSAEQARNPDSHRDENAQEHFPEDSHAPQPQTINDKQETENMEVHKHPHHVTHKKKWGEYLLEFLMLFLAVFLGFIAENIREHIVEQNRAKEFSRSLVQDLQNDTAAINNQKNSAGLYIAVADSLLNLSKTKLEGRNAAQFSFYTRFTYWTVPISWNRNTFEQIKNSGSLRYFKNDRLLKKLLEYDAAINDINSEADQNKVRGNILLTYINSIIEPERHHELSKHLIASLDTMSVETKESFFSYKTTSLENKREKITEMLNMVVVQQRNFRNQISNRLNPAQMLAIQLINDLKKEYHLE